MASQNSVPCRINVGIAPLLPPQFQQTELGGRQAMRTPQDKERVKRVPGRAPGIEKIEPTDRAIDRLISPSGMISHKGMKNGLSEEEIEIVEGE